MIVDYHCHWTPRSYYELIEKRNTAPRAERNPDEGGWVYTFDEDPICNQWNWLDSFEDLDGFIADMDKGEVGLSAVSAAPVGGELAAIDDVGFAKEGLALLNQELADAQKQHPDRIRALAMLPLQDADAAIEMLDHSITELGMAGVCIGSNVAGASIAPPQLMPFYKRMEELGVPIVIHPSLRSTAFSGSIKPSSEGSRAGRVSEVGLAWVYDTSLAVLSLISNGVFDECPNLKVLHPHTGGVVPFITGRFEAVLAVPRTRREYHLERPVNEYLKDNVYVDIAAGSSPAMIEMAVRTYGADHIVFGSDYPFIPRSTYHKLLGKLDDGLAEQIRTNRLPGIDVPAAS